jgi:hypothetical protein
MRRRSRGDGRIDYIAQYRFHAPRVAASLMAHTGKSEAIHSIGKIHFMLEAVLAVHATVSKLRCSKATLVPDLQLGR